MRKWVLACLLGSLFGGGQVFAAEKVEDTVLEIGRAHV